MAKIEGGCLCGKIRYESDADPAMQAICHCKTCQKNSGSAYSLNVAVPADSLSVRGETLTLYVDRSGASGQEFHRHFCSICGSHIYAGGPAYGPLSFIKVGTMDDPSWVEPNTHIWTAEKMPCVEIPADAAQFPANPG
ncbi:MAG: GFA family protein [Pseudomonadota bacterium]